MKVTVDHRPADALMGRFGGGWQWKLGFQASRGFRTVIVNLLVFSVRIERHPRARLWDR